MTSSVIQLQETDKGTAEAKPDPLRPTPVNITTPSLSVCCGEPTITVVKEDVKLVPSGRDTCCAVL
jgi:hypothetical protein